MKKLILGLLVVLTMIMISGCSINNADKQIGLKFYDNYKIFNYEKEEVWSVLANHLLENANTPILNMDKETGFIKLEESPYTFFNMYNANVTKYFVLPKNRFLSIFDKVKFNTSIHVASIDKNKTKVTMILSPTVYDNGYNKGWVATRSTGLMESDFLSAVNRKLLEKNFNHTSNED